MSVFFHFVKYHLNLARAETQTTAAERKCISAHAQDKKRLAEIGIWHGVTTSAIRRVMAPEGSLWAIDPFPCGRLGFNAQYPIAKREVEKYKIGSVKWIRQTGVKAAHLYHSVEEEKLNFLFIDGDHSWQGISQDWEAWSPLIAPDGIVAIHDSHPTEQRPIYDAGSVLFTKRVVHTDSRFSFVECIDTLSVFRRVTDVK